MCVTFALSTLKYRVFQVWIFDFLSWIFFSHIPKIYVLCYFYQRLQSLMISVQSVQCLSFAATRLAVLKLELRSILTHKALVFLPLHTI